MQRVAVKSNRRLERKIGRKEREGREGEERRKGGMACYGWIEGNEEDSGP